jgi:LysM repeat protein
MPEATGVEATATAAPPMPIITPTPVDPTAVAEAANEAAVSGERPDTYVVAENDTLYGIAAQFEVDLARLVEENGLDNPNDIYVGQELIIPPLE